MCPPPVGCLCAQRPVSFSGPATGTVDEKNLVGPKKSHDKCLTGPRQTRGAQGSCQAELRLHRVSRALSRSPRAARAVGSRFVLVACVAIRLMQRGTSFDETDFQARRLVAQ